MFSRIVFACWGDLLIAKKFFDEVGSFVLFLLSVVISTLGFFVLGVELAGGLLRSLRVVMVISHRRSCMASSIITEILGTEVMNSGRIIWVPFMILSSASR